MWDDKVQTLSASARKELESDQSFQDLNEKIDLIRKDWSSFRDQAIHLQSQADTIYEEIQKEINDSFENS